MPIKKESNKPTSSDNQKMFTGIIVFYAILFVVLKLVKVFFGEALTAPNLILSSPIALLAIWGGVLLKRKAANWLYIIISVAVILLIHYFEEDLITWLQNSLV